MEPALSNPTSHRPDPDPIAMSRLRSNADSRAEAADRRRMERELATATREGRLALFFQPRLRLESGRPVGAEAIIRWPHRKRGLLPQGLFLPLAERSGQTADIGGWTLLNACLQAATWPSGTRLSVNIAASHLAAPELLGHIATALERSAFAPERLELGVGEAALQDVDGDAFFVLAALRDLGVGVAVDDFGAGTASLTLLRRLPLTTLRLDRALIRDLPGDREAIAITRSAIETGHALGLDVAAVGIETEKQRSLLADAGCDEGQGPLFSPPLEGERIATRLAG
jgi:EAL domain-containing protein (putative c-di-GMP-specific phosphodiesterase class I)